MRAYRQRHVNRLPQNQLFNGAGATILSRAVQLGNAGQYQQAIQVLMPLVTADPYDFIAWFEYAYALACLGHQGTMSAIARVYNNSDSRRQALGLSDVVFPDIWRYGVLVGRGSTVCPHGLTVVPDAIYLVLEDGSRHTYRTPESISAIADATAVNITLEEPQRWVGIVMKINAP